MAKNARKKAPARTAAVVALCVVLALTVFLGIVGVKGLWVGKLDYFKPWLPTTDAEKWPENLTLGLDLRGGVYVEYSAEQTQKSKDQGLAMGEQMNATIGVLESRLTGKGYTEAAVSSIENGTGIRVEVPGVYDQQTLLDLLGKTAELDFVAEGENEPFMTGENVKRAYPTLDERNQVCIGFELDDEGARIFGEKTRQWLKRVIYIYLDYGTDQQQMLANPVVSSVIDTGSGIIQGTYTEESAQTLATQINSGAVPLLLTQQKVDTVSATLGDNALSTAVTAALIGIALVMLIMIFRYRLNGVVASWALCLYIIILFFLLALIDGIQITLPGLAGIVLGIGMAVDANVIIFERFNEEIRRGRTAAAAARLGFKSAMSAILDANVTTLIAGVVLLIFGTGSVQGFAKTLLLGVLVSMFSAVLITRWLMNWLISAGAVKPALYCGMKRAAEEQTDKRFDSKPAQKRSRVCLITSAALIGLAVILSVVSLFGLPTGINLGIDFAGGMSLQYDMHAAVDQNALEDAIAEAGITGASATIQGAGKNEAVIRIPTVGESEVQTVENALHDRLAERYPDIEQSGDISYVGPVAGARLVGNAIKSVLIAAVLMLIYIAVRFDFFSGLAAVLGLLHDVLMMLAFMVFLRFAVQMNSTFIAAMLTIVGYSINNTIVIFDRIRENVKKNPQERRVDIVTRSVRECLGRTLTTTATTLVTIVLLYILGVDSIKEFALPLIIGIVSGVYSANMLNGYVWAWIVDRRNARRNAGKASAKQA